MVGVSVGSGVDVGLGVGVSVGVAVGGRVGTRVGVKVGVGVGVDNIPQPERSDPTSAEKQTIFTNDDLIIFFTWIFLIAFYHNMEEAVKESSKR